MSVERSPAISADYFSGNSTSKMHFGSTVPGKIKKVKLGQRTQTRPDKLYSRQHFSGNSTSKMHFGSTVPGKMLPRVKLIGASLGTLAQFHLFYFSGYSTSKMHFGSTVPGKIVSAYRGRALHTHAGPILPFFIFPGTVLPFFYFSVVRKVPEKPILFLPHP